MSLHYVFNIANPLLKIDPWRYRRLNFVILKCFICRWEHGEVVRWESSEVAGWEKWKSSEVARWERWESVEVGRWEVPGFI